MLDHLGLTLIAAIALITLTALPMIASASETKRPTLLAFSGDSQPFIQSKDEYKCVKILHVSLKNAQVAFVPTQWTKAMNLISSVPAMDSAFYVETLVCRNGELDVIRSWLQSNACR